MASVAMSAVTATGNRFSVLVISVQTSYREKYHNCYDQ